MRIAFTGEGLFNPKQGGVERVTDILAKELSLYNFKIYYIVIPREGEYEIDDYKYPAETYILPDCDPSTSKNIECYQNLLLYNKIDIVINQRGGIFTKPLAELFCNTGKANCKVISVFHEPPTFALDICYHNVLEFCKKKTRNHLINRLLSFLFFPKLYFTEKNTLADYYNRLCITSDKLCVLTQKDKLRLSKVIKRKYNNKISVIGNPNTYDIQPFDATSVKKENLILFVGRLSSKDKRPDRIFDIWEKLQSRFPDWKLLIIGDGEMMPKLKVKASTMERVELLGQTDPLPFYDKAKILCNTSNFEGWGMIFTEAICRNCLPIAFNNIGIKNELKLDNKQLVKLFSISEYVEKLSDLMSNENLRLKLLKRNRDCAIEFTPQNIAQKWIDLFSSLKNHNDR